MYICSSYIEIDFVSIMHALSKSAQSIFGVYQAVKAAKTHCVSMVYTCNCRWRTRCNTIYCIVSNVSACVWLAESAQEQQQRYVELPIPDWLCSCTTEVETNRG